ncbi:hypothetical protein [Vibrio algarum]|uniref:Uncharacterized protein n=1 Tax=Vibrio algarum TaxID=3020714 RepID=A0ABT4YMS9_9VIBR|nr:hypothetical protein [Vibrio sp. KJ40-1]MDB1122828.1 hypothetical protein [Vibrio sp. KJ40-1]
MDIDYNIGKSIADLPITDPIHKPCESMAGMVDFDPKKCKRGLYLLDKLREKHGLKRTVQS